VLTTTYFQYNGEFFEQADGVAMGSPLSPAVANLFMEHFEEKALNSAPLRPKVFLRFVDDTFIVWPHGVETLKDFLAHMNSQHPNIVFTMEMESDGRLPFLDVLVQRKADGQLGHSVYRKPTHTDLYLHAESHHHPSQGAAVLTTLFHRAATISDAEHLGPELKHLKTTFRQNGYSDKSVSLALRRTLHRRESETAEDKEKPLAKACLPFVSTISGKIARILRRYKIETIHKPPTKLKDMLVRAKDPIGLKTPGVYRVPCGCGKSYIGETGRTIETRLKEHRRHLRLGQLEKSAIAEHWAGCDKDIQFQETKLLCRSSGYWERLTKEAIEIRLEENIFNRDSGYAVSNTWKPVIKNIKRERAPRHQTGAFPPKA
jgi:hypothetical protein